MSFLRASAAPHYYHEKTISRDGRRARTKHCLLQLSAFDIAQTCTKHNMAKK